MKRHYPRGQNPYILILGVIVILSMLFTIFSQKRQDKLAVYQDSNKVETKDSKEDESKKLDVETEIYTDNEHHFSLSIPKDWEQVTKGGYPTFVHSASASSLQVQVLDYDPAVNNESQTTLSAKIADDGKTFVSFDKKTTSSYELMYQDFQNSTYDYIEEVYWDRDNIIKLVCTFNDKNYEKIKPYYELILNSFAWQRANEIPADYAMYYNDQAGFEVMIPAAWTLGASGNAVVATDGDTGASETLMMTNNTSYFDSVTATDMAKILNTGQSGFMMNSYDNSKETATAKCTYIIDNVQYQETVYGYATGKAMYFVMFDYEAGTVSDEMIELCGNSFRTFGQTSENTSDTEEPQSDTASSSADTNVQNEQETSGK